MRLEHVLDICSQDCESPAIEVIISKEILAQKDYIYVVASGEENILQIGKSKPGSGTGRLAMLMKGITPKNHNKSFIVGLASVVLDRPIRYFIFYNNSDKLVQELETRIHEGLNIKTNKNAATIIDGKPIKQISEVNSILWKYLQVTDVWRNLAPNMKIMASDLFNYVDSGKVKIQRLNSYKYNQYKGGDVLSGGTLKKINLSYFANLWEIISNGYFKYNTIHKFTDSEFEKICAQYNTSKIKPSETFTFNRSGAVLPLSKKTFETNSKLQQNVENIGYKINTKNKKNNHEPSTLNNIGLIIIRETNTGKFHLNGFGISVGGEKRDKPFEIVVFDRDDHIIAKSDHTTAERLGIASGSQDHYNGDKYSKTNFISFNINRTEISTKNGPASRVNWKVFKKSNVSA